MAAGLAAFRGGVKIVVGIAGDASDVVGGEAEQLAGGAARISVGSAISQTGVVVQIETSSRTTRADKFAIGVSLAAGAIGNALSAWTAGVIHVEITCYAAGA